MSELTACLALRDGSTQGRGLGSNVIVRIMIKSWHFHPCPSPIARLNIHTGTVIVMF